MSSPPFAASPVTHLTLQDFRTYAALDMEVSRPLVALVGENGAGKTNLLEALSLFMPGRGLRRAELDLADRLQALGDLLRRHRGRIRARLVQHELDDEDDADDRHEEGEQDDNDQLLRRLDERGVFVVRAHGIDLGHARLRLGKR